jgi:hypothetical protein
MCDEWRHSFQTFLEDMGNRPHNLTLERIDNNKGYSPDNCKWDTRRVQRANQRVVVVLPAHSMSNITQDKRNGRWIVRMRMHNQLTHKKVQCRFVSLDEAQEFRDDIIYEKQFHRELGLNQ